MTHAAEGIDIQVDPGDAAIERGAPLLVVARFPSAVPPDARLVVEDSAQGVASRPMTRSLEDPTFATRVDSVATDLTYHVDFAGRSSKTFKISVFEYPELKRADARLVFPSYTALEPKTVEDIRHVTAVEGTELTLSLRLNKEVAEANLVDESGKAIALTPPTDGSHVYKSSLKLDDSKRYKLRLVDKEGRANKLSSDLLVNVTRNRPAVVTMTAPSRDVRVSPVEELALKAKLEDDFGVVRHGLSYTLAGHEPKEITLEGSGPKVRRLAASHLLDFEAFHAKPDQLVTYFFWAEDVGPDGQPRRTDGDMFFAEVRHFEEIFRQGEQPPSGSAENEQEGQQQNAEQAAELAELQKEIINGTWKVIRRETKEKISDEFVKDVKLLRESQDSAIDKAGEMAEKLTDATSKASLEQATEFMRQASKQLNGASTTKALRAALVPEQSAYQALLKLRAREFNIIRSNQRQRQNRSRSAGSPSQRQLNQLELSNDENRYEEQSKAQEKPQTERERQQQEDRQVSNRLRELARRQADLNERIKELQSALEAAKTDEARKALEQQLKRLRDQQQQVLRDTDELQERMEREENRDRMADSRQQVEQSREHVRQASEALEQGQLSRAVTEGARASRQMNELREELRKNASNRFNEQMTEMRDQARKLDDDQSKLTEQLEARNGEPNGRPRATLRDTGDRDEVRKGLEQQRERLDNLLERMQTTVQDAEETEPLLAKGLYDTVRKAADQKVPDELKIAEQLAAAGIDEDAAKSSQRAGEGIKGIREGVESAAQRVLGDETASLRRAQSELDNLADQINREVAQAGGNPADPQAQQPGQGNQPGERGQQKGQQPGQGNQPGEQGEQDGQQPGQGNQPGERGQQKGQQPGQGNQPGEPGQQKGQQPGQGNQPGERGQQKGQQPGQGNQPGEQGQQKGQQPGQGNQPGEAGQQPGQGNQPGQRGQRQGQPNQRGQQQGQGGGGGGGPQQGGLDQVIEGISQRGPSQGPGGPITGEGFRQWSDRMRDVEELLDNPDLRAEAARIRDRVRGEREEFKRHSKEPDAAKLQGLVAEPLNELRKRVTEEIRRRESPDALVPIDRDPVPPRYSEGVRRYYERLGSGK